MLLTILNKHGSHNHINKMLLIQQSNHFPRCICGCEKHVFRGFQTHPPWSRQSLESEARVQVPALPPTALGFGDVTQPLSENAPDGSSIHAPAPSPSGVGGASR